MFEFPLWAGRVIGRLSVTSVTDIESWNSGILTNTLAFFLFLIVHFAPPIIHQPSTTDCECTNAPIHQHTNAPIKYMQTNQYGNTVRVGGHVTFSIAVPPRVSVLLVDARAWRRAGFHAAPTHVTLRTL